MFRDRFSEMLHMGLLCIDDIRLFSFVWLFYQVKRSFKTLVWDAISEFQLVDGAMWHFQFIIGIRKHLSVIFSANAIYV